MKCLCPTDKPVIVHDKPDVVHDLFVPFALAV